MTTPLLSYYEKLGIKITASGDKLRLSSNMSALTPEIQAEIRNQRVCIFSELSILNEQLNRSYRSSLLEGSRCSVTEEQLETVEQLTKPNDAGCHIQADNSELNHLITRAQSATTLVELESILKEFSAGQWSLLERRDMSNAYTPVAKKLIEREGADKWKILDKLAFWCGM